MIVKTYPLFSELHKMTITERNQQLFDLRKQLDQKKMEMAWIETQIMAVNAQYDRENRDTPLFDEMFGGWMKTTAATYSITVTTDEGHLSFLKDMPTRPKTQKGIKSQNNKLSKWVEKQYPNFTSYDISLLDW